MALYASKKAGRNNAHYHDGERCLAIASAAKPSQAVGPVVSKSTAARADNGHRDSDVTARLPSRDDLVQELERRLARAASQASPLSMMLVELDGADEPGGLWQQAARACMLQAVYETLAQRELLARFGDFSLGAILVGRDAAQAIDIADLINSRFNRLCTVRTASGQRATLSFGVAESRGQQHWAALVSRAEQALASSTAAGGGRIHFHTEKTRQPMLADLQTLPVSG
jgi:GGDEF domain-containing protein